MKFKRDGVISVVLIAIFHILAVYTLMTKFSFAWLLIALLLAAITGFGITAGYHRFSLIGASKHASS